MFRVMFVYIICGLYFSIAQAVIVRVDILKGKNPKTGKEQCIYLLGDVHSYFDDKAFTRKVSEQKEELLSMFLHWGQNNTKIIIEGWDTPKKYFDKNYFKKNVMTALMPDLLNLSFDVSNVEYRFMKYDYEKHLVEYEPNARLLCAKILKTINLRFERVFSEINNLTPMENCFLEKFMRVKERIINRVNYIKSRVVPKILESPYSYKVDDEKWQYNPRWFDLHLLDMKALKDIANEKNKNKIVMIAGVSHTKMWQIL